MTLLTVAIGPRTAEAAAKLAHALQHLSVIDPAIEVRAGGADDEVVIGGMSEMQLENVIDRLRRDFAVEASIGRPQVAYMETVTRAAEGESQYKGESGAREYAHVKVRVYPSPAASQPIL